MPNRKQNLRKRTDTATSSGSSGSSTATSSGRRTKHESDESSTSTEDTLSDTEFESEESISTLSVPEQKESEQKQSNDVFEDNVIIELDQIQGDLIKFTTSNANEITIEKNDLVCLAGQNYLNDVVIQFYLEYIKAKLIPKTKANKCFIFSTYFFASMLSIKRNPKTDNYYLDATYVKSSKWTENRDIFQYDYLIVPIFNANHWSLAIICHAAKLLSDVIDLESKERLTKINLKAWFDNSILITKRIEICDAAVKINKENLKDRNGVPYVADTKAPDGEKDAIEVEENDYTRQLTRQKAKRQEKADNSPPKRGPKKVKLNRESDNQDVVATSRSDLETKFHELFDEGAAIPVAEIATGQRLMRTKFTPLSTSSKEHPIETVTLSTSPSTQSKTADQSLNVEKSPHIPLIYSPSEMIYSITEVAGTSNSTRKPVQESTSNSTRQSVHEVASPKKAPIYRSIPLYGIEEDDEVSPDQSTQKDQNRIILESFNSRSSGIQNAYLKRANSQSSRNSLSQNSIEGRSFESRSSRNITQRFKDAAFDFDSVKFDDDSE